MLQPARRKYRKEQKGRNTGVATRGAKVSFGEYGLKAVGRGHRQGAGRDAGDDRRRHHRAWWLALRRHPGGHRDRPST